MALFGLFYSTERVSERLCKSEQQTALNVGKHAWVDGAGKSDIGQKAGRTGRTVSTLSPFFFLDPDKRVTLILSKPTDRKFRMGMLWVADYSAGWIVEGSSFLISLQRKSSISMSER
jgi:hypothetical protein